MSNQQSGIAIIRSHFQKPEFKQRFLKTSGAKESEFEKEISFALMAISSSDKLQQCSMESILKAVYSVAAIGLSLNPVLKHAALTTRYINGQNECVLFPMYQGLLKLVYEAANVSIIITHIVYEGDDFELILGSEYSVSHVPTFKSRKPFLVYSIATLKDGNKIVEYMTADDVENVRNSSDSYKAYKAGKLSAEHCIWVKHELEMWRKSCLRRITKYLPKHAEEKLATALALDEGDFSASHGKVNYIESLLLNCTLDPEQIVRIEARMSDPSLTNHEADDIIDTLSRAQSLDMKKQMEQNLKQSNT